MLTASNRLILLFLTASICIIGLSYLIIQSGYYISNKDLFSMAISIDMVIFIPLIYFLLIRKQKISKLTIIPVIVVSYFLATLVIPTTDHTYLQMAKMLLVPLEVFGVGFILYKARHITRLDKSCAIGNDFLTNLRNSLYTSLGENRVSDFFATEISIVYYGLFAWASKTEVDNESAFTYHRRCGYTAIVGVFSFLIIAETFSLHLLLSRWSNMGAWIFTALSVYALVFLLADYNAAIKRPILIRDHSLQVRIAFRWVVTIPFENIRSVDIGVASKIPDKDYLRLVLIGSENIMITLKEPKEAKGLYGISKTFRHLGLCIDNKEEFCSLIDAKIKSISLHSRGLPL